VSRYLIIGASGFIGSRLCETLEDFADVLGTSTRSDREDRLTFDLATDDIADVLPKAWRDADDQKFAILSAAVVPMDRCRTEEAYARSVMIDGSQRCLMALAQAGFTPVFLSTSYVFDGERGRYKEDDTPNPLSNWPSDRIAADNQGFRRGGGMSEPALTAFIGNYSHAESVGRAIEAMVA
jgi:dTDP-4-dehydrorhamnose reductase